MESKVCTGLRCERAALETILGYGTRLSEERDKLSALVELYRDLIIEASTLARRKKHRFIKQEDILDAIQARMKRHASLMEKIHEVVKEGIIAIDTTGTAVGQINGLTVQQLGSSKFGAPSRISAQTFVGRRGVLNIEHLVDLGGALQQKGVLSLQGYLRGTFGQELPLSFTASITFEQNYGLVEGDSASMGELCAIISSLSKVPLYQGLAVTGTVNQKGQVQAIGGVNEKIEGYYHTCKHRRLTGKQGVIIPEANRHNVILMPEVSQAVKDGRFHIFTVNHVSEALDLLTNKKVGKKIFTQSTKEAKASVYGRAYATLKHFDEILAKRKID